MRWSEPRQEAQFLSPVREKGERAAEIIVLESARRESSTEASRRGLSSRRSAQNEYCKLTPPCSVDPTSPPAVPSTKAVATSRSLTR